jgi:hemerythrin
MAAAPPHPDHASATGGRAAHALGVAALDVEHGVQFDLLDAFRRALQQPQAHAVGGAVLRQLLDFTDAHFLSEQLLMRLHAYPGYEAHVQEHDRLNEELRALEARYAEGEMEASLAAADALSDWLEVHVRGHDRALAAYLRAQGRAEA